MIQTPIFNIWTSLSNLLFSITVHFHLKIHCTHFHTRPCPSVFVFPHTHANTLGFYLLVHCPLMPSLPHLSLTLSSARRGLIDTLWTAHPGVLLLGIAVY